MHNWDQVARLDIGAGDRVLIEKAGEIIPQILEVRVRSEQPRFTTPTECPVCKTPLAREEGKVVLACPNRLTCPAQRAGAIEFFAGRGQLNIDGLGEKVVAQLIESGLVTNVADLFTLTAAQLLTLDRFAKTSADNLVAAIEKARTTATASRVLAALGIPHVGGVAAGIIAAKYRTLAALRAACDALPVPAEEEEDLFAAELEQLPGIGEVIAIAIARFLRDPHARAILDALGPYVGEALEPIVEVGTGPLTGKTLVVTGTLSRPRGEIQAEIEAAGGKIAGSVSKKTSYLVAGADTGKTKLDAATKHGVAVIDEAALAKLIAGEALEASAT
jgi:DNA ligase (NAD+)